MLLSFVAYAQITSWEKSGCLSPEGVATIKCAEVVFQNLLFMASTLVLLILFIMFIVGAFKYLTSGGDAEKLAGAQNTLKFALIGTFVFLGSYLMLNIIQVLFLGGIDSTRTGGPSLFKFEIPVFK